MANRMPSMVALLGLLAVAGYQHRDKIAEALGNLQKRDPNAPEGQQTGLGGMLGGLADLFGGGSSQANGADRPGSGNVLTGGLGDLLDSFKSTGQGDVADSWVTPGVPTRGLTTEQVAKAVGENNLAELSQRTGLPRDELLTRLATAIPQTVDELTPEGRMPTESEAQQRLLPDGLLRS